MNRRLHRALPAVLALALFVSCTDRNGPTDLSGDGLVRRSISDGSRGGDPNFFWLTPTVPTAPTVTGPFDDGALDDLTVEVCQLDAAGACTGDLVEQMTSTGTPVPARIQMNAAGQYYSVNWMTGRSHVDRDAYYRVRVVRAGALLGSLDVDLVQNTPALKAVNTQLYVGIVRGQQLELRFRIQRPTARTNVKVNEVESSGGVPGDWIELYNSANVPVSLAGYIVRDNDDTHTYVLPPSASVAAGGFYVVEEADLGFGLGAADAARFFTPDNATLVDTYSWTAHATTTYGRCPDGSGAFQTTTTVTKGAANDCSPVIRINEVESSGGVPGDWVELFNPNATAVGLGGYVFKDNDDTHGYAIPAGTTIPAGGYLTLEEAAFGFGLGSPDAARLFEPNGLLLDSYDWTAHAITTYGRCPSGTGSFTTTTTITKGAANDCSVIATGIRINEIESSGGTPGDWVELFNPGSTAVTLAGYVFKDNDDTHSYVLPAVGSTIAAGGYLMLEEAAFGFGLGSPDAARLFAPNGVTLVDSYSWTPHATTTYGRCPNGTGSFTTTTSVTKGAANNCGNPVRINEVESSGGTPGDWVELFNPSPSPVDISSLVFRDNDNTHNYAIPAGTTIAAGGYYLLEEAAFGFGLGSPDAARLFVSDGVTIIDSLSWTPHAGTTYGRCPNGTGVFTTTLASTKGASNSCPGDASAAAWPGDAAIHTADDSAVFHGNLSGLAYEGSGSATPGTIWAARNGPGTLFRLIFNGSIWTPDPANGWGAGKALHYMDGTGDPDAEGVAFAAGGSAGGMYVSTERNNSNNGVSRNSVLRFDAVAAGTSLNATNEWNLTADLPANGANLGLEAVTWIPDAFLTARGFFDESKGHAYTPADYTLHGTGLFFVGVEADGKIYAFALNSDNSFTRVATISSGFIGVMDLEFDRELNTLWAVCDDGCNGRSAILEIDQRPSLPTSGRFIVTHVFERPTGMPNFNNEGFTVAPQAECMSNRKPVFWSDDTEDGGHALRQGTVTCGPF